MSGAATASFVYDGDGNRVKSINPEGTTVYVGNHTEVFTPVTAVPIPPANPAPAVLSFGGKTLSQSGPGLGNLSVSLRRRQTCSVPGTGYLSATALGSRFSQLSEATLYIYKYTGQFVSSVTEYCSGGGSSSSSESEGASGEFGVTITGCTGIGFPLQTLSGGSYQGYVRTIDNGFYKYSTVQSFAISHGQTTFKGWVATNPSAPSVGAVTPLPWTGSTSTTNTTINSTVSDVDGNYRLNYATPSCNSGCNCTLHVDLGTVNGYPAVSASAPSPGTVISSMEIRYPWATSGSYNNNNFTLTRVSNASWGTQWRYYYYAGTQRIAMRVEGDPIMANNGLYYLFGDHLASTSVAEKVNTNGSLTKFSEVRYKAWGEDRYTSGSAPTSFRFTGQRVDSYINLLWYGSRWYDPALGRFTSPDSIVPGVGEGGNPNAVGYLGASTYSPLTVDYHESKFLNQLNLENRSRLQDPTFRLPPVPTNSIAFDRYAYSLNNPVRFIDPSGHFPQIIALLLTPPGLALIVATIGVGLYFAVPGVRETVTNGIYEAGNTASNGINLLLAKKKDIQFVDYLQIGL